MAAAARETCVSLALLNEAEEKAMHLEAKRRAVAACYGPRGLSRAGVERLLGHVLNKGFLCLWPGPGAKAVAGTGAGAKAGVGVSSGGFGTGNETTLDLDAFTAALFRWQSVTDKDVFLDLVDDYWRVAMAAHEAAAARFESTHPFKLAVELAGRRPTSEDYAAFDAKRSQFTAAAREQEAVHFLSSLGLTPEKYARLLQAQRARQPECAKLDDEWRAFVETEGCNSGTGTGTTSPLLRRISLRFEQRLKEMQGLRLARPVAEEVVLRR